MRLVPSCTRGDIIDQTLVHGVHGAPLTKKTSSPGVNSCQHDRKEKQTRASDSKFFGTLIRTLELGVDLRVHKLVLIKFYENDFIDIKLNLSC